MKKIAIWAPLRYANYGDDLQAIILAQYIKSLGHSVKVYQLEQSLSQIYELESVQTIDELCAEVDLCMIAGGALLTPFHLPKRILSRTAREYEQDFKELYMAAKKYRVKFCAISMGGDGMERIPFLWYGKYRRKFLKSDCFLDGTVRLSGDVKQMRKFDKIFVYYPDFLLQTPEYISVNTPEHSQVKKRVALNLKRSKLAPEFINNLLEYARKNDNVEFFFMTTHMEKMGLEYQYLPDTETSNIHICRYKSPTQLLSVMSSMDLFITSMLHLGLTGLSVGVPCLSYRGPGKAKSFLTSIGGNWAVLNDDITFAEVLGKYIRHDKSELYNRFDIQALEQMKKESTNHLLFCREIINKYGS